MVSNLPIGSGVSAHLVFTGSPDPRQLPFGPGTRPYPTSYAETIRRRCRSLRLPVSCCLSAIGLRFLGHPAPAGELSLPHGRPTGAPTPPDPNGVVVLHMSKLRPGRAPPLPRGRWCAPDRRLSSGRHLPLSSGQSLRPRWNIPSAGVTFTRRHQRFTHVHPSPRDGWLPPRSREASRLPAGLLLARGPRMEQGPLRLLPRASHPAVTRDARRGGDRPSRTGPGTTPSTSAEPPNGASHLHSCTLTSHVVAGGLHHHRGHLPAPQPVRQRQHLPLRGAEAAGLLRPPRRSGPMAPGSSPTIPALPMSMPHTRSRYSGSSVTSSTRPSPLPSLHLLACRGGTARGTGGERRNLTRVLEATMNGPWEDRLPASG